MKTKFIKIKDISEIDPSKATVYDLNNRYIDSKGKMYSLKYNRHTRKIEIIRIIRTPANSAPFYEQKLQENKKTHKDAKPHFHASYDYLDESDKDTVESAEESIDEITFDPDEFITETLELMLTHKERLNGIIMNINNSPLVSGSSAETKDLQNTFRNIDIDGIQRIEKVLNLQKEMLSYPRSINYYLSRLDNKDKKFAESISTEKQQMKYVFLNEMYHSVNNLYRTLKKIINDVHLIIRDIDTNEISSLTHLDKQNIEDAKTSIDNTIVEIKDILNKTSILEAYLSDVENF
jgi:hypothetical protein